MIHRNVKGALIASAVAALCGCGSSNPQPGVPSGTTSSGNVKCVGVNSCKAQGACGQADHACKAQNSCKGKGITLVGSASDCTSKGGQVM